MVVVVVVLRKRGRRSSRKRVVIVEGGVDEGGSGSSDDDEEEKWPGKGYKELIAVKASADVGGQECRRREGVSKLPDAEAVRAIGHSIGTVNYYYPSCC